MAQTSLATMLPPRDRTRLSRLALRYELSLPEFSKRVLQEVATSIPEEKFEDYENPSSLKASFNRAMKDWQGGRVRDTLEGEFSTLMNF